MKWKDFVDTICDELIKGDRFSDYRRPIENEQALTRTIADGLRKCVASSFNLADNSDEIYHMLRIGRAIPKEIRGHTIKRKMTDGFSSMMCSLPQTF